eukprot:6377011-Prorocentrum_lima.AAC.1
METTFGALTDPGRTFVSASFVHSPITSPSCTYMVFAHHSQHVKQFRHGRGEQQHGQQTQPGLSSVSSVSASGA